MATAGVSNFIVHIFGFCDLDSCAPFGKHTFLPEKFSQLESFQVEICN